MALASLLPLVEHACHVHVETVLMALDVSKAYDSACHRNMDSVMDWVGVLDCFFYRLYC